MGIEKKFASALLAASLASGSGEAKEPKSRLIPDEVGSSALTVERIDSSIEAGKSITTKSASEAMKAYLKCVSLGYDCSIEIKVYTLDPTEEYAESRYGSVSQQKDPLDVEFHKLSKELYNIVGGLNTSLTDLKDSLSITGTLRVVREDLAGREYTIKPSKKAKGR